jgi:MoaA/NifB/PqqE/SkfB family radical SAM enzyme
MKTVRNQFPNVPKVDFTPTTLGIWKWHFPEDRIGEVVDVEGKKVKKLLTLDINIPEDSFAASVNGEQEDRRTKMFAKSYPCPHSCPGCFNNATVKNPIMSMEELYSVLEQALSLGLESVKFLGPGELTINPKLFEILDWLQERNITIGIFTKAAVMGSDTLAQKYHGMNSLEFTKRLINYPNVTFLIGGRSFDPKIENKFIPTRWPDLRDKFDYHEARNIAIERLCEAGMNSNRNKPRISIQANPVTAETIDGVFEMFEWSTDRNIPICITTTMVSGKGHGLIRSQQQIEFEESYEDLSVKIYTDLLSRGIFTKERLKHEGVSPYVGMAPCNQLTHGLYIHYDGEVWMCPGNDTENFIVHPNVRNTSLVDIWTKSKNYQINAYNNGCVKAGVSIPINFYRKVLNRTLSE